MPRTPPPRLWCICYPGWAPIPASPTPIIPRLRPCVLGDLDAGIAVYYDSPLGPHQPVLSLLAGVPNLGRWAVSPGARGGDWP